MSEEEIVKEEAPAESSPVESDDRSTRDVLSDLIDADETEKSQPEAKGTPIPPAEAKGFSKAVTDAQPAEPIIAPRSLTAKERELWKSWPRELQELVARREKERDGGWTQKVQELKSSAKFYEKFNEAIEPYAEEFRQAGVDPAAGVVRLASWHRAMLRNPIETGKQFLASYGIDPTMLLDTVGQQYPPQTFSPQYEALARELQELKGILGGYQEQAFLSTAKGIAGEVEQWKKQKGDDGEPLRPYVEEIEADMVPIVKALKASNPEASNASVLDQAYHAALAAHPDIREAIDQKRSAKAKMAQIKEAKQTAQKAQRANASITSSGSGNVGASTKGKSTRSVLEGLMDGTLEGV